MTIMFGQIIQSLATPEWLTLAGGVVMLWIRMEHRLTRVETKLSGLEKRNTRVDCKDSEEED